LADNTPREKLLENPTNMTLLGNQWFGANGVGKNSYHAFLGSQQPSVGQGVSTPRATYSLKGKLCIHLTKYRHPRWS
jgi:hypothetical protein